MKDDVSALFDGELDKGKASAVLEQATTLPLWREYALISDVLHKAAPLETDVLSRVLRQLENEPTPEHACAAPHTQPRAEVVPFPNPPPALARTRFPVWAMAASAVGMVLTGWLALQALDPRPHTQYVPGAAPLASAPTPPPREDTAFIQAHRDYFLAHQAMAGAGPLSSGVQYVRTMAGIEQGRPR
jgi:hypothetical protein